MENALSRKVEDYLEAIFNIIKEKGYARTRDMAYLLEVKPPSVVEMIKKLDERGFVLYRKYEGVTLTPEGEKIGRLVKGRHDTIKAFLEIIDVPERIADKDACIIEHELYPETIGQIKNLVEFVKSAPDHPEWIEHFKIFCETGKHPCEEKNHKKRKKF